MMTFYDLLDVCRRPGCPVCRVARDAAFDALDALLYENVTDPGVRDTLRASWGFCPEHAEQLRAVAHAASGASILYEDFLAQAEQRLGDAAAEADRLTGGGGIRRRFGRAEPERLVRRRAACVVCRAARGAEGRALAALLDRLDDARVKDAYGASGGLCLPHLEAAWFNHAGHPRLGDLLRDAAERTRRLRGQLAEFMRKLDYRFRDEPLGDEGRGWLRAVEWFAGSRPEPETHADRLARKRHVERDPEDGAAGADGGALRSR